MWNSREENKGSTVNNLEKKTGSFSAPAGSQNSKASIGDTIVINGEISGNEDLIVQGRVEGKITLKDHTLTIGCNGVVNASIEARVVNIEGKLEGNIKGSESITINESGHVDGDIEAPRVILKDGCHFKGGVEMRDVEAKSSSKPSSVGSSSGLSGSASLSNKLGSKAKSSSSLSGV